MTTSQDGFRIGVDIGGTYMNAFCATHHLLHPNPLKATIFHVVTPIQRDLTYRHREPIMRPD